MARYPKPKLITIDNVCATVYGKQIQFARQLRTTSEAAGKLT